MEKWEIRPLLTQKPLNRSSPKFAWVINDHVMGPYPHAKFHQDTNIPFRPPNMRKCASSDSASFYSASALLAMQSTVLATGIPSVCPSVTFRYCVQTNEDTIVRFSASARTFSLVSGEVKFIRIFAGDHPKRGR